MAPSTQCPTCKKNITKAQSSVQCANCLHWFHLPCANVSEKSFAVLADDPNLFFKCQGSCTKPPSSDDDDENLDTDLRSVHAKMDRILKKMDEEISAFSDKLDLVIREFRNDIGSTLNNIRNDISKCNSAISAVETNTSNKFSYLEIQNNSLHRRLNRCDIIINGLPAALENLPECVKKIASYCKVAVTDGDINSIFYINQGRSVVAKFNSVKIRDGIMKEYFKTKSLTLADVIGGEILSRVYLNDHLSPAANKLYILAKRLLKQKKILKFWLPPLDKPLVQITCLDGTEVEYDYNQCLNLV